MNNLLLGHKILSNSGWGNVDGKYWRSYRQLQSFLAQVLVLWNGGHVRFHIIVSYRQWKTGEKGVMLLQEQRAGCYISPTALTVSVILRSEHFTRSTGFAYVSICTSLGGGSWGVRSKENWRKMERVSIQSSDLTWVSPDDPVVLKWITFHLAIMILDDCSSRSESLTGGDSFASWLMACNAAWKNI